MGKLHVSLCNSAMGTAHRFPLRIQSRILPGSQKTVAFYGVEESVRYMNSSCSLHAAAFHFGLKGGPTVL